MDLFTIQDFKPVPTEEFMAMDCVQELYRLAYNKGPGDHDGRKRIKATKEIVYVYYFCNYKSEFSNYPEADRDKESLKAAGLPEDHEVSMELMTLIGIYSHHVNNGNRVLNLLESARNVVDKLHKYFNGVKLEIEDSDKLDVQEKKTIIAGKVMDNLDKIPRVIKNLDSMEERVRKEQTHGTKIKGDAESGRL